MSTPTETGLVPIPRPTQDELKRMTPHPVQPKLEHGMLTIPYLYVLTPDPEVGGPRRLVELHVLIDRPADADDTDTWWERLACEEQST